MSRRMSKSVLMRVLGEKEKELNVTTNEENNVRIEDNEESEHKATCINDIKCTNIFNNLERQRDNNKRKIQKKLNEINRRRKEGKRKERKKESNEENEKKRKQDNIVKNNTTEGDNRSNNSSEEDNNTTNDDNNNDSFDEIYNNNDDNAENNNDDDNDDITDNEDGTTTNGSITTPRPKNSTRRRSAEEDSSISSSDDETASFVSPISIIDTVQIIDNESYISSSDESQLDYIPPQESQDIDSDDSLKSILQSEIDKMPSTKAPQKSSSTFTFDLDTVSINRTGKKKPRTAKHKNRTAVPPIPRLNWSLKSKTYDRESTDESSQKSNNNPSSKIQSLETLDDYETLEYIDHLTNLLSQQNEDLIQEDEWPNDDNQSIDPNEVSTATNNNDDEEMIPTLDPDNEASPVGEMKDKKIDTIRISTFNPNGMSTAKLKHQMIHCEEQHIDIQCFSEINQSMTHIQRKKSNDTVRQMDCSAKSVWSNTDLPMDSSYKPGGTGIVALKSVAGRVKESGRDRLGRWSYQVFDSGSDFKSVIFSIYRCSATQNGITTAYQQQLILQAEVGRRGPPLKYFKFDLIQEIKELRKKYGMNLRPYILGDFNHCPKMEQTINDICHTFQLVDIYKYFNPNQPEFKTYRRGQKRIDRALIPEITARKMK